MHWFRHCPALLISTMKSPQDSCKSLQVLVGTGSIADAAAAAQQPEPLVGATALYAFTKRPSLEAPYCAEDYPALVLSSQLLKVLAAPTLPCSSVSCLLCHLTKNRNIVRLLDPAARRWPLRTQLVAAANFSSAAASHLPVTQK